MYLFKIFFSQTENLKNSKNLEAIVGDFETIESIHKYRIEFRGEETARILIFSRNFFLAFFKDYFTLRLIKEKNTAQLKYEIAPKLTFVLLFSVAILASVFMMICFILSGFHQGVFTLLSALFLCVAILAYGIVKKGVMRIHKEIKEVLQTHSR